MLKNYLKVTWRNLTRNKLYSFINIAGLSVGIASCVLIFLYVEYEFSYDVFNTNARQIYRLTEILHLPDENNARAVTSPPMAPALQANFQEVLSSVRISYSGRYLSFENKKLPAAKLMYADSSFFGIFSFQMISGDPHKALVNPYSIVLTESMAEKYFPHDAAPEGKIMQLSDTIPLTVTGVVKDAPANSHFSFDCILSRTTIDALNQNQPETEWFNNEYYTYLLLPANCDYRQLENRFSAFIQTQMKDERKASGLYYDLKLQPLLDIHLRSNLQSEINPNGDMADIYVFSAAAFLILLIACVNFINLSTAKSVNRAKEIGLRKVIGADRFQLILQFLGESFLFTIIATAFSIILIQLAMPYFNAFIGESLSLFTLNKNVLLLFGGIIITAGLIAGIYPAFLISSFSPVKALKGPVKHEWRDLFFRKGLVVLQFTIAIVLIAGASLVYQQLRFLQNQRLGLNKAQLLEVKVPPSQSGKDDVLLSEFLKTPGVVSASLTSFSFKEAVPTIATLPEGFSENQMNSYSSIFVDHNFLETFQIPLAAGRDFSPSFPTDSNEAFIINETAVKAFHWRNDQAAIGKKINWGLGKKGKVIGVVKDFNYSSLHDNIKPLIIQILPEAYNFIALRVKPADVQQTLGALSAKWNAIAAGEDFQYSFLDDDFASLYKSEQDLQRVLGLFTVLSIFIACLGLFGLATFTIRQRFKEIGIRKVIGASVASIVSLLSAEFVKLVCISILIATPLAWLGVSKWLQNFAYQTTIDWWTFAAVGLCAIIIALATVSFQAIKAAVANPVKSLRME